MIASFAPSRLSGSLLAVRTLGQFARFLRKSQAMTGCARRMFVIASADRLRYQVQWSVDGCRIDRLDTQGTVLDTATVGMDEFFAHPLIDALRSGQLYTPPGHH